MNVLIVENEKKIAEAIKKSIMTCEIINIVKIATNFDDALSKISSNIFDIIIMDIFLDEYDLTGLDLCKKIREKDIEVPIIVITGQHSIHLLEEAFKLGVNDYIRKPFNTRELIVRISRWIQLSKEYTHGSPKTQIKYKELLYDTQKNDFYYKDKKIPLTKKNKNLLLLLIKNAEHCLSKEYITEKFWGDFYNTEKRRNLRSNIQTLRKSLEPYCADWIKTRRGEGYILKK